MVATSNEKDRVGSKPDRRLGDEWVDWDGTVQQNDTDTSIVSYVLFAALMIGIVAGIGFVAVWLVWPRFESLGWSMVLKYAGLSGLALLVSWYGTLVLALSGIKPLRYILKYLGGVRWSIAPIVLIAKRFGISRDKIGNAFVKIHNKLEIFPPLIKDPAKLLILAPRCLSRESITGLKELKDHLGFSQVIAIGGTEARKAIAEYLPQGIIAVACERDLILGIKDLNGRIPVVAFTNQRPEGPCKNTLIPMEKIEQTIRTMLGKPL